MELIDEINGKGVCVRILNMGDIDDTPIGKLLRTMMLGFAEFERDMIVERTQEGRRVARQKPGYRGRTARKVYGGADGARPLAAWRVQL